MIGANELKSMKDGVVIINAARGGIINENELLSALKTGKVGGVGIDTWDKEPPINNPFATLPNVVMTPHIGASTTEAQLRIAESVRPIVCKIGEIHQSKLQTPGVELLAFCARTKNRPGVVTRFLCDESSVEFDSSPPSRGIRNAMRTVNLELSRT